MSVTEQMVIHAQEFNTRVDQIEVLAINNHKQLYELIIELLDKIDLLEFRITENGIK